MIVAMGVVYQNGTLGQGYNVTSSAWNDVYQWYEITLTGITYTGAYVTLVTPGMANGVGAVYSGQSGKLIVRILDGTPAIMKDDFSFVVLQCP